MPPFFTPTPAQRAALETLADGIPEVQRTLVANHPQLSLPDRGAHQQQLAGSRVVLTVASTLPAELRGLGLFQPAAAGQPRTWHGIGRISTGLGCPHAETDADFLGLMVAFCTPEGHRVDFVTINDPTSPTDTAPEFLALLRATADAARGSGALVTQANLLAGLARHAGLRAPAIALHVSGQTARTVRSRSACQQYWTGIVRARDVLGKFTFAPTVDIADGHPPNRSARYFTEEWRARQQAGPIDFDLYWIPFVDAQRTSLTDLTAPWSDAAKVRVGSVRFPQVDAATRDAALVALLATEMGANPGNWIEVSEGPQPPLPATEFTAARQLAYHASQQSRGALRDEEYRSFFEKGAISETLADELIRRFQARKRAGHWTPDVHGL